jgi:alkylhydroperoxidase family enzyme
MTDAQIASIKSGGADLADFDRWLIKAADELVHEHCISDTTWQALAQRYSTVELMEVVGLIGCYTTIAMVTRSFEMQLESKEETAAQLAALRTYT